MLHLGIYTLANKPFYIIGLIIYAGHHFGGLLDSAAANMIVEQKIDSALAGPEGIYKLFSLLFPSPSSSLSLSLNLVLSSSAI